MPFSWLRVPNEPSPKVKACMGKDQSKAKFASCVESIVAANGGKADPVMFETNGRWARAYVYWETQHQKRDIVLDLQAEEIIDLISPAEVDTLIAKGGKPAPPPKKPKP